MTRVSADSRGGSARCLAVVRDIGGRRATRHQAGRPAACAVPLLLADLARQPLWLAGIAANLAVPVIGAWVRLTPGELDTVVQAAAGRSNKQVAGHLHLPVRTGESHLQRAYEKLGISGRHELPAALRHQPDPWPGTGR